MGAPKTKAVLNKDDKRAQAAMMMVQRLGQSKTIEELSKEYNVSKRTVDRRLARARVDGVPDEARRLIINDFLPLSLAVCKEALNGDDMKIAVQVALKIIDGLDVMKDPDKADAESVHAKNVIEDSFEVYRARVIRRHQATDATDSIEATAARVDAEAGGSEPETLCLPAPDRNPFAPTASPETSPRSDRGEADVSGERGPDGA